MKIKALTLAAVASLGILSTSANAGMMFYSADPQICQKITGTWNGGGDVSAWPALKCSYQGTATVTDLQGNGDFNTHFKLHKTSSKNDLGQCPENPEFDMKGNCNNGTILFKTDLARINGEMNSEGTRVDNIKGNISFATIDNMTLTKQ